VTLTTRDERVLVGVSLAATRDRLERVARVVLDRDDAVTELLRACAAYEDGAWAQVRAVFERRGQGNGLMLLDLVVEIAQQERERRGEARTWNWPGRPARGARIDTYARR
jgi:hypothetical protein